MGARPCRLLLVWGVINDTYGVVGGHGSGRVRGALEFTSPEHARSVLNRLPDDAEWKERKFGFNALPENAEDSSSQRYVVYFESGDTR